MKLLSIENLVLNMFLNPWYQFLNIDCNLAPSRNYLCVSSNLLFLLIRSILIGYTNADQIFNIAHHIPAMKDFLNLRVVATSELNHNTFKLIAKPLNPAEKIPELITSSFVYIYTDNENEFRPYTPILSTPDEIIFAIKSYQEGCVSQYLQKLAPGDRLTCSYPIQKLIFDSEKYRDILMIAGGTGVTPMIQIFEKCIRDRSNNRKIPNFTLFFCNLSPDNIFISEDLEKYRDFVKIIHVLERIEKKDDIKSNFLEGRINADMIRKECVMENELLFDFCYVCGPNGMLESVCGSKNADKSQGKLKGMLKEVGFSEDNVYKF